MLWDRHEFVLTSCKTTFAGSRCFGGHQPLSLVNGKTKTLQQFMYWSLLWMWWQSCDNNWWCEVGIICTKLSWSMNNVTSSNAVLSTLLPIPPVIPAESLRLCASHLWYTRTYHSIYWVSTRRLDTPPPPPPCMLHPMLPFIFTYNWHSDRQYTISTVY